MNILHYSNCKPSTCFGHLLWPSTGRSVFEGYITKATKLMYNYTILCFKYVI